MVQRLHFVLPGLLIAVVGFLWLGTRRAQAEIDAHRTANQELMARLASEAERLAALPGVLSMSSQSFVAHEPPPGDPGSPISSSWLYESGWILI